MTPRPPADVLADVLDGLPPLTPVTLPLARAGGLVLGRDVHAPTSLPPQARAAMDGVAARVEDLAGASVDEPVRLRLDGASLAGACDDRPLVPGTVRQIATGATLPRGADTVVRVEDLDREGDHVVVTAVPAPGRDVRPVGDDAAAGAVLAPSGRRLDVGALGGLAGAGVGDVVVHPAPRVVIIPTGDEIVAGTTPDAVGPAVRRLLRADGVAVSLAPAVADAPDDLQSAVTRHAVTADVVVTVGGVSVGPRDHAGDLVRSLPQGAAVGVAVRPGRPFAWGRTEAGSTVLCLPGSPVAAVVSAILFARPVCAHLAARAAPTAQARRLGAAVEGDAARRSLVPAACDDGAVDPVPGHGAADLARLAATSALIDLPPGTGRVEAGASVATWVLP